MKQQQWLIGSVALATTLGLAGLAGAQQPGAGGPGGQGGNRPNFGNMTPEQRQQFFQQQQQQRRADWIRQVMTASGFADTTVQDAVIAFMAAQDKRGPLQEQAHDLSALLIDPNSTNDQLKTSLADFRQAVATDKARHDAELAALDTQIKYSTQPRLETLLVLLGAVGYEIPQIGGVGAVFPDSPYGNRGGRGGQGGGPGGRGGQGGGPGGQGGQGGGPGGRGGRGGQGGGPGGNAPQQ